MVAKSVCGENHHRHMRNHGTTREEWLAIGLCAAEDAITRLLDACKDCNVTESIQTCLKHTLAQVREAVAVSASADQVHPEHPVLGLSWLD